MRDAQTCRQTTQPARSSNLCEMRHMKYRPCRKSLHQVTAIKSNQIQFEDFVSIRAFKLISQTTLSDPYHLAVNDVVESFQKLNSRTFPATGTSDERETSTRFHVEIDSLENFDRLTVWIAEVNVSEIHQALARRLQITPTQPFCV